MKEYTRNQASKRYQDAKGKGYYHGRLVDAYMLQANSLFKNSELAISIDQVSASQLALTSQIFCDINIFTSIKLWSDYVSPLNWEKNKIHLMQEEAWRNKLTKPKEFAKFQVSNIIKHKLERDDKKQLSQDPKSSQILFEGVSKQLTRNTRIREMTILSIKLSNTAWKNLGRGVAQNKSLAKLSINLTNIQQVENMKVFMDGFQCNMGIISLDLSDNSLTDEAGMFVLNMIKFKAEKRNLVNWSDGLRHEKNAQKQQILIQNNPNSSINIMLDKQGGYYANQMDSQVTDPEYDQQ